MLSYPIFAHQKKKARHARVASVKTICTCLVSHQRWIMSRPIVNKRPGIAVDEIQDSIRNQFPLQQNVNGWFVASYVGSDIKITASGTGGVDELKDALKDNEVCFISTSTS